MVNTRKEGWPNLTTTGEEREVSSLEEGEATSKDHRLFLAFLFLFRYFLSLSLNLSLYLQSLQGTDNETLSYPKSSVSIHIRPHPSSTLRLMPTAQSCHADL